jgi:hypothetical protein
LGHAISFLTNYLVQGQDRRKGIYPHLFHLASLYLDRQKNEQPSRAPLTLAPTELIFLADLFSRMGEERAKDAIEHFVRAAAAPEATTYEKARASQGAGYASFQRNKPADALEHYARAPNSL